ncbi:MAG: hypothetical protein A2X58_05865 [Nitrospirae bacterium GWC2_56_14]|nr:MAG: hypothetical protein A2X58_05865 [Nitrospirae bacterium GWC2_56_14]
MYRELKKVCSVVGMLLLLVVALAHLPGCSGSGGGTAPSGTLQVGLTDKQSDAFQQVVVTIREVRLVPAGLENAQDNDPRLPIVVSYGTPHIVDILTLRFQQEILGTIIIPAGNYNQVRLILEPNPNGQGQDPVNYLTLKSDPSVKIPLKTPSGQQSGLKVLGQFEVKPGIINAILLDFDPNTAIVDRGNGDYNLKPTGIRIVQPAGPLASFGSLTGTVISTFKDWSSATVTVVPQGGSSAIAGGTIFSNISASRWEGAFSAFVPAGTYRVHVQTSGFVPYSSALQPVISGSDTPLGDVLLTPLP